MGHQQLLLHIIYCINQEWDLSAPGGSKIQLTFNSFDIEDDASCSYDYVQVGVSVTFT